MPLLRLCTIHRKAVANGKAVDLLTIFVGDNFVQVALSKQWTFLLFESVSEALAKTRRGAVEEYFTFKEWRQVD